MKVAVTGASGFVGRYVLTELTRRSHGIVAVTRDAARAADWPKSAHVVEMDIGQPSPDPFDRLGRPDVLIHLAWDGLPNYTSLHHFETELPRQYRFLKALVKAGLPSLLVTGTCFEYGMRSGCLSENLPTQPSNPYGYAKDALRRQLEFLRSTDPFTLTWARLFYLYGDGQAENSLLPQLKAAIDREDKVFNISGGEQLRDYLPVTEVAKCLVSLVTSNNDNGIVNVCSGKPISVRTLVEGWIEENDWSIELNLGHYPYPDYEPMAFWGDRRRLDSILGKL